ncbi:M90 family metallopeptidase [Rubinisphaera margarita]|uniref:M90 family metallopeptidase n=1 Tax=Rubinisphaera margarita TaxID=2909586 RepID=UPI001EE83250|nr:M90 family metallopeptidase [Rubinisphaera margarita]MCG6158110.1 zinc-dependent peptidase [Rubinisphaera margarita]
MWNLLRAIVRPEDKSSPLPDTWQQILKVNVPYRNSLSVEMRERLDAGIRRFVEHKYWEGCNGLSVTDEHRLTIAGHAMRLTLGFDDDHFDDVKSILLYPTTYRAVTKDHIGSGVIIEGQSDRLGEAWYRGPVILAWSDIQDEIAQSPSKRNVILHEFAHQLDFRNGRDADGVPPIESETDAERWLDVMRQGFERLCDDCRHRRRPVLDCYGTTNRAEFFAVATEAFFETPEDLKRDWPELHAELRRFFRQDP